MVQEHCATFDIFLLECSSQKREEKHRYADGGEEQHGYAYEGEVEYIDNKLYVGGRYVKDM